MKEKQVSNQAELDAAIKDGFMPIIIGNGSFEVDGSAQVTACDSAQVTACDSAQVRAYDSAQVRACGSSQVRACGSAQVRACDSAQVRAYGSSQVTACGSAQVTACDSAQVTACDSAQVRAYDSSQVRACDSAQVRAYGSAQVRASKFVAITKHTTSVKVIGGKLITSRRPKTAFQWCSFYGLKVEKGVVVVFKAVDSDFKSIHNGFGYTPGTTPVAADWDGGKEECGGGLHFSPRPFMALEFNSFATKFIACPVRVKDMRAPKESDSSPQKIKAKGCCAPVWEVDIDGNKIV